MKYTPISDVTILLRLSTTVMFQILNKFCRKPCINKIPIRNLKSGPPVGSKGHSPTRKKFPHVQPFLKIKDLTFFSGKRAGLILEKSPFRVPNSISNANNGSLGDTRDRLFSFSLVLYSEILTDSMCVCVCLLEKIITSEFVLLVSVLGVSRWVTTVSQQFERKKLKKTIF